MNRRNFLQAFCIACAGGSAATLLNACTSTKHSTAFVHSGKQISIRKSEFALVKKNGTQQAKFIIIKPENFQFPIAVYQQDDQVYFALLLQCTHQGCELSSYETALVCPCHGAEFNIMGRVTQGPAETDLKTFVTTHDHENIYIHL